tara:strand:- start:532 stop:852 length:321 start_codon:yes stop_codon:yes gene_type:complete
MSIFNYLIKKSAIGYILYDDNTDKLRNPNKEDLGVIILLIMIWIYSIYLTLYNWKKLETWAKVVCILSIFGFVPVWPAFIITIAVSYISSDNKAVRLVWKTLPTNA